MIMPYKDHELIDAGILKEVAKNLGSDSGSNPSSIPWNKITNKPFSEVITGDLLDVVDGNLVSDAVVIVLNDVRTDDDVLYVSFFTENIWTEELKADVWYYCNHGKRVVSMLPSITQEGSSYIASAPYDSQNVPETITIWINRADSDTLVATENFPVPASKNNAAQMIKDIKAGV